MAPVNLEFLNTYRSRGVLYAYYRRDGKQVRLRGEPGSSEFLSEYQAAHAAHEAANQAAASRAEHKAAAAKGTLGALIESYQASPEWTQKRAATQGDYQKALTFLEQHRHRPVATMNRSHVIKLRDMAAWNTDPETKARTLVPSRANKVVAVVSILLTHAINQGERTDNPALGVPRLELTGEGHRAWTDAEVQQFLERTDDEWRFNLLLALGTGQRGQDQVAMQWRDYDGSAIKVIELKNKKKAPRWIPCHPELKAALDARTRNSVFILTRKLQPRKKGSAPVHTGWPVNAFQKAAGVAIRDAGLFGPVWHGLRATAASWLAEAGCSDAEIMAVTGHTTTRTVQHYRRGAAQRTLATAAVARLGTRSRGGSGTPSA